MRFPVDIPPLPDPRRLSGGIRRRTAVPPVRPVPAPGEEAAFVQPTEPVHGDEAGARPPVAAPQALPYQAGEAPPHAERRHAERRAARHDARHDALLDTRLQANGRRRSDRQSIDIEI